MARPTSPPRRCCSAAAAVAASGMTTHSMRSKCAILGPAVQAGAPPARGDVAVELLVDDRAPATRSSGLEAERAAADHLRHLRERVGLGQPLRHDRQHAEPGSWPARRAAAGRAASAGTRSCCRRAPTARRSRPSAPGRTRPACPSAGCWRRSPAPARACRRGSAARGAGRAAIRLPSRWSARRRPSAAAAGTCCPRRTACRTPPGRGCASHRPWSRPGRAPPGHPAG